jgi:hypothetical protein
VATLVLLSPAAWVVATAPEEIVVETVAAVVALVAFVAVVALVALVALVTAVAPI